MRLFVISALLCFLAQPLWAQTMPFAELQILDKVTTQKQILRLPMGRASVIGGLRIVPRRCDIYAVDSKTEAAAFLEIYDAKRAEIKKPIFSGWMFKSSPSLSALEHAIYDVVVLSCAKSAGQSNASLPE